MPLLVALALLALACAPSESAPTPADVPPEAAQDASVTLDGAPLDAPADAGRTDAAEGSVPDTLPDAPAPGDAAEDRAPVCPAGTVWCGSSCSALDTLANCGACGEQCCTDARCPPRGNRTNACVRGTCGFACLPGYADCDSNPDNGCETNLRGDRTCGACARSCLGRPHAARGACGDSAEGPRCAITCEAGYADCDRDYANGCEASLSTDPTNCGVCGRVCMTGYTCRSGACVLTP